MIIKALKLDGTTQENVYVEKERSKVCALNYFNIKRTGREETRKKKAEKKRQERNEKNRRSRRKLKKVFYGKAVYQMGQMLIKYQKRLKLRCDG